MVAQIAGGECESKVVESDHLNSWKKEKEEARNVGGTVFFSSEEHVLAF
jgi:hypothetical protein